VEDQKTAETTQPPLPVLEGKSKPFNHPIVTVLKVALLLIGVLQMTVLLPRHLQSAITGMMPMLLMVIMLGAIGAIAVLLFGAEWRRRFIGTLLGWKHRFRTVIGSHRQ